MKLLSSQTGYKSTYFSRYDTIILQQHSIRNQRKKTIKFMIAMTIEGNGNRNGIKRILSNYEQWRSHTAACGQSKVTVTAAINKYMFIYLSITMHFAL